MRVSDKQVLQMYEILVASLGIVNSMAFSREDRRKLAETILNQQDEKIKKLSPSINHKNE